MDEAAIRAYLETFHETYLADVRKFIPEEHQHKLLRYSVLPARVLAYLAQNGSVGFQYVAAPEMSYEVSEISEPPERAVFTLFPGMRFFKAVAVDISDSKDILLADAEFNLGVRGILDGSAREGTGILVEGASFIELVGPSFRGFFPLRVRGDCEVTVFNARIHYGRKEGYVGYAQFLGQPSSFEPTTANAIAKAKDEVLAALTDLHLADQQHKDLASYLKSAPRTTAVLVLGDFNHGMDRIDAIKALLGSLGYQPFTLLDIPEDLNHDLRQRFLLAALIAKFAVFENSTPSGHIAELLLAEYAHIVGAVLHLRGQRSSFMTVDPIASSKLFREWEYEPDALDAVLRDATQWAESTRAERESDFRTLYPWRPSP